MDTIYTTTNENAAHTVRVVWRYDSDYSSAGSYALDTEEETRAAVKTEFEALDSGELVALWATVERREFECDNWQAMDTLFGIVIGPEREELARYAVDSLDLTGGDLEPVFERELAALLVWAVDGNRVGNPYCMPPVSRALAALGGDLCAWKLRGLAAGVPLARVHELEPLRELFGTVERFKALRAAVEAGEEIPAHFGALDELEDTYFGEGGFSSARFELAEQLETLTAQELRTVKGEF